MSQNSLEGFFQVASTYEYVANDPDENKRTLSKLRRDVNPLAQKYGGGQIASDITNEASGELLAYLFENLENAASFALEVRDFRNVNRTKISRIDDEEPTPIPFNNDQINYLESRGFQRVKKSHSQTLI